MDFAQVNTLDENSRSYSVTLHKLHDDPRATCPSKDDAKSRFGKNLVGTWVVVSADTEIRLVD